MSSPKQQDKKVVDDSRTYQPVRHGTMYNGVHGSGSLTPPIELQTRERIDRGPVELG